MKIISGSVFAIGFTCFVLCNDILAQPNQPSAINRLPASTTEVIAFSNSATHVESITRSKTFQLLMDGAFGQALRSNPAMRDFDQDQALDWLESNGAYFPTQVVIGGDQTMYEFVERMVQQSYLFPLSQIGTISDDADAVKDATKAHGELAELLRGFKFPNLTIYVEWQEGRLY